MSARLTITVGTTKITFTRKTVSKVNGTRVEFTDGSWCDAGTGEVCSRGPGSIAMSMGGADLPEDGYGFWPTEHDD